VVAISNQQSTIGDKANCWLEGLFLFVCLFVCLFVFCFLLFSKFRRVGAPSNCPRPFCPRKVRYKSGARDTENTKDFA
jgi:hypothetical protein